MLKDLSSADEHRKVKRIQEYYADYHTVNRDLFTFNIPSCVSMNPEILNRICDGLGSVLLSLKKMPVIRYQKNSEYCRNVAQELTRRTVEERELFLAGRPEVPPVLLIIDRRADPVTPLLTQWTYQAMIHEVLGIANNRCILPTRQEKKHQKELAEGKKKTMNPDDDDFSEVVLSSEHDEFYRDNMFLNWGDLGTNIKAILDRVAS